MRKMTQGGWRSRDGTTGSGGDGMPVIVARDIKWGPTGEPYHLRVARKEVWFHHHSSPLPLPRQLAGGRQPSGQSLETLRRRPCRREMGEGNDVEGRTPHPTRSTGQHDQLGPGAGMAQPLHNFNGNAFVLFGELDDESPSTMRHRDPDKGSKRRETRGIYISGPKDK
ncbi:hypothetical protein Sjap_020350 [Stephania japonica]|uniref:Uncharacterized protein n=1 Tax=Stephania japonica TaxID=461633 RepID=A0AAP0I074_9MAGN